MCGYERKELAGNSIEILHVDHEHYVEFGEKLKEAFDREETAEFDLRAKRETGKYPTHHTVSLLKDHDGRHVGLVSMVRDTSERRKH